MTKATSLGPLEQQVMSSVWTLHVDQPVTVRAVCNDLSQKRDIAYTTVMTIMARLEEKGLLKREKENKAHTYIPTTTQQKTVKSLVGGMFQSLVDQFGTEAITAFADEVQKLPKSEQQVFKKKLQHS